MPVGVTEMALSVPVPRTEMVLSLPVARTEMALSLPVKGLKWCFEKSGTWESVTEIGGFINPWELQVMVIPTISGRGSNRAQPFSVLNFLEVGPRLLVTKGYSSTHKLMREDGQFSRIRIELTIDWFVGI